MATERQHPKSIALIPIKDRKREVLIDLIEQWKDPYPKGIGVDSVADLVEELVTKMDHTLETINYSGFMMLFHFIEDRYRTTRRRKMLAEKKSAGAGA